MTKNEAELRGVVSATLEGNCKKHDRHVGKFQFERVHDARLPMALKRSFVGQKRTARFKQLVFVDPQSKRVFKGPYRLKKDERRLRRAAFRSELFGSVWRGNVCRYRKLVSDVDELDDVYFEFRHITGVVPESGGQPTQILGLSEPRSVLDKRSQRFTELSMALDSADAVADAVLAEAFVHYVHRYVCDPIVGDASLRNVLVTRKAARGIDFEECRKLQPGAGEVYGATGVRGSLARDGLLFSMLSGGKRWSESKWNRLIDAVERRKLQVLDALQLVGDTLRDGSVQRTIDRHNVADESATARMALRYRELLRELQALWPDVDASSGASL